MERLSGAGRKRIISPASLIALVCLVPLADRIRWFLAPFSYNYIDDIPSWLRFLLLSPTKKLVVNPVVRISVTIATTAVLAMIIFDLTDTKSKRRLIRMEICIWIIIAMLAVIPVIWTAEYRLATGNPMSCHDGGILQTEAAMEMLLSGKNPYLENYDFSKEMMRYAGNHAVFEPIHHNPYLPASFILPIPFRWLSLKLLGYYDQHFFYLLCYLFSIVLLKRFTTGEDRLALMAAVAFNPAVARFLVEGRNDIVIFLLLVGITISIEHEKPIFTGILTGTALAFKQFTWLALPFLWVYAGDFKKIRRKRVLVGILALCISMGFILPFLIWDAASFYDDTIAFNTGRSKDSYLLGGTPGYGLSNFVLYWGLVADRHDYFPFWIPMLLLGGPTLWFFLRRQKMDNSRRNLFLAVGGLIFMISFASRFFHNNYIVLVSMFLTVAFFTSRE